MTTFKHLLFTLCFLLCFALLCNAQEQTPSVEVTTDSIQARFAVRGEAQAVRVEVFAPSGEKVFDSGKMTGETVEWSLTDRKGQRISDGLYLATVTITDAAGKAHKRLEQVSVSREASQMESRLASAPPPDQAIGPITGEGTGAPTSGRIARFTGTNQIGDSIVVESANRLIINPLGAAPNAVLQVNGLQPAASAASGTTATALLTTTGGKGGDTTGSGKVGGKGASISLVAGQGGDAVAGSTNGSGGSITLQPGSPGAGGAGGTVGNVLIAPTVGNVGIGTITPQAKLHVEAGSNFTGVYVKHSSGISVHGDNTFGIGVEGVSNGHNGVSGRSNSGAGVSGHSDSGTGVFGISNGTAVRGFSVSGRAVNGESSSGHAGYFDGKVQVNGALTATGNVSIGGNELYGNTVRQMINLYNLDYGIGIQNSTFYFRTANTGNYNWYIGGVHNDAADNAGGGTRLMRLNSAGNLTVKGSVTATNFVNSSDRHMKANFATVNPRFILDRLAAIPIQTWSYKAEDQAVRHIGPVAQDFRAAFKLGTDDRTISTVDASGVTMAAIQGLYQITLEKEKRIEQLNREAKEMREEAKDLRSEINELRARLLQLEEAVKSRKK